MKCNWKVEKCCLKQVCFMSCFHDQIILKKEIISRLYLPHTPPPPSRSVLDATCALYTILKRKKEMLFSASYIRENWPVLKTIRERLRGEFVQAKNNIKLNVPMNGCFSINHQMWATVYAYKPDSQQFLVSICPQICETGSCLANFLQSPKISSKMKIETSYYQNAHQLCTGRGESLRKFLNSDPV